MAEVTGNTVVGIFEDSLHARSAIGELKAAGFGEDGIGMLARHADELPLTPEDTELLAAEAHVVQGASTGALTGAGLGSLWALAVVTGVLPVIGPIIAGGVLAALAVGAAGGALAGGLLGALVGLGIPEDEAERYEEAVHAGQTIVTVRTDVRQAEAIEILNRHGALDIGPPKPGAPELDEQGNVPHLDLRPERLFEHDTTATAGGFTSTGGVGESAYSHDSQATFHMPGKDPEERPAV